MRVEQEPAYVLHARPYRETSLLVEVFSRRHGRLGLLAKGAKRRKSPLAGLLLPFLPLRLSWSGRGELGVVTGAEGAGPAHPLRGDALYCGFYVNELLLRLLHRHDAHEGLFGAYEAALETLAQAGAGEAPLRLFEKRLLAELGYALVLDRAACGGPLEAEALYRYEPERGPVRVNGAGGQGLLVHGRTLLALGADRLDDPEVLGEAKRLMRGVLAVQLDGRPLHSRVLFRRLHALRRGAEEAGP